MYSLTWTIPPLYFLFLFQNLSLSLSLSLILSAILGFPKLKIIFSLTNGLHIGRLSTKIMSASLTVLQE